MKSKIKGIGNKSKNLISSTAKIGDLNGDGKVDAEDARIAAEWAKNKFASVGVGAGKIMDSGAVKEAARLGKEVIRSDLAKDAATGAAIGAAVAIPVPLIGPVAGAAIGAGLGVYKNITKKGSSVSSTNAKEQVSKDIHAELLKLDDLRQKNIITEEDFISQKKKILDYDT